MPDHEPALIPPFLAPQIPVSPQPPEMHLGARQPKLPALSNHRGMVTGLGRVKGPLGVPV